MSQYKDTYRYKATRDEVEKAIKDLNWTVEEKGNSFGFSMRGLGAWRSAPQPSSPSQVVYAKVGVNLWSWGERITVNLANKTIKSEAAVLADFGKNEENVNKLKSLIDAESAAAKKAVKELADLKYYNHFRFYFYNKTYPANFLQTHLAMGQNPDFFGGVSLPSPQKWLSLQNSCTRGRNPPKSFNVNERLFFILLHGFVASLQSSIEIKRENPFTSLSMSKHGFLQEAKEPGKEFFKKHNHDITKISGMGFSYEEYAKVVGYYSNIYHKKVDKAIRGDSTVLMDDLEFDFRIGMKAGILNAEVIIESLFISGFGNQLKSFFPVLKNKLRSFSIGEMNCYCNDLLYRYSKIAKLSKGTEKATVISAFRKDRKKIYDNIHTSITLRPDALEKFVKSFKELKDKPKKVT